MENAGKNLEDLVTSGTPPPPKTSLKTFEINPTSWDHASLDHPFSTFTSPGAKLLLNKSAQLRQRAFVSVEGPWLRQGEERASHHHSSTLHLSYSVALPELHATGASGSSSSKWVQPCMASAAFCWSHTLPQQQWLSGFSSTSLMASGAAGLGVLPVTGTSMLRLDFSIMSRHANK